MRAIVSLLKFIVGASFLLSTIGLALLLGVSLFGLVAATDEPVFALLGGAGIYIALAAFIALVLYSGMVALLISGHDRLCEISLILRERNELLRLGHEQGPDRDY